MATLLSKMIVNTERVRKCVKDNPGVDVNTLAGKLKMGLGTLYPILDALSLDPDVCDGQRFMVTRKGVPVTVSEVEAELGQKRAKKNFSPIVRVIFLFLSLFDAIEEGGLTLDQIRHRYESFLNTEKSEDALKRMIYRDINTLSQSLQDDYGNILLRPEGDNRKYRLNMDYIPRLVPESAAAVYLGMSLLNGTVMDEPITVAQREIGKAYLKKQGKNNAIFRQRFYFVKDTLAEPRKAGSTFRTLIRAVLESHCVRLVYGKMTGEKLDRKVEPLGMLCKRGVWYLVARNPGTEDVRVYRVDQIEAAYPRETMKFQYPQGYTVESYLGESWGVYADDDVRRVALRFSPEVAPRVKNLRYHRSQRIVEEGLDGSVVLEFDVCGHVELVSWILQWGHQVTVLEPAELQARVREAALAIAEKYM